MGRNRRQNNPGCLPMAAGFGMIIGLFVMLFHMMFKTKGPWRWIFIGLLILAVTSHYYGWEVGIVPFFIAAPILCWISDYLTNEQSKMSIPIIITGSVVWIAVYFAFLF